MIIYVQLGQANGSSSTPSVYKGATAPPDTNLLWLDTVTSNLYQNVNGHWVTNPIQISGVVGILIPVDPSTQIVVTGWVYSGTDTSLKVRASNYDTVINTLGRPKIFGDSEKFIILPVDSFYYFDTAPGYQPLAITYKIKRTV